MPDPTTEPLYEMALTRLLTLISSATAGDSGEQLQALSLAVLSLEQARLVGQPLVTFDELTTTPWIS